METGDFIEIVFENCDSIILTSEYLNHLYLGDVIQNYSTIIDKESGRMRLVGLLVANDVKIQIDSKMKNSKLKTLLKEDGFERLLKINDITQIWINFSGKKEQYFVYWNEENDFSNRFQLNELDEEEEELIISISKENSLK